jgi:hypothetical protein
MRRASLGSVRVRPAVVLAVALLALAVLGFSTDVFRSPRAVVRDALTKTATPADTEIRFLVDVQAHEDPEGKRYHHLHFRAGPGPFVHPGGQLARLEFPFTFQLERRGLSLLFRGSSIIRDGGGYLRIDEMPSYGDLQKTLEGRWLQLAEETKGPGRILTAAERRGLFREFASAAVIRDIHAEKKEAIRDVNARRYELTLDQDRLEQLLGETRAAFPDHPINRTLEFIAGRLKDHRVERAVLWIRPRTHEIVRVRFELVPKADTAVVQRIVADATILPRTVADVSETPKNAVRLREETIARILGR